MKVCVYCSASERIDQKYKDLARDVGIYFAKNDLTLVYGGGVLSMMGAVADAIVDNGGKAIGFIPEHLRDFEGGNQNIQELYVVDSMHTRKLKMSETADAFLILPGGFGTMDEFFEIMTWKQLALHNKPIIILNAFGYWTPLVTLMHNIIDEKFARPEHRYIFEVINQVSEIKDALMK
ncbi:MAG: TIGR00730 family Rossman fold protein [Proteobacteria bacterium]|nr:TIGR00730 family Rossman fold protein [Pseudomonadota bacterium]